MAQETTRVVYKVVINHEEQYAVWLADQPEADGYRDTGKTGTQDDCTAYIQKVWTDMRPLSLRQKLGEK